SSRAKRSRETSWGVVREMSRLRSTWQNSLKSFRMPIGFLEAPFAGVFEEFVHRREQYPWAFHVQPQIEIEFVVEKMNVAVAQHAKERGGGFEISCVNDAVLDLEIRGRVARDAVAAAGNNFVQNSRKRPENRYG